MLKLIWRSLCLIVGLLAILLFGHLLFGTKARAYVTYYEYIDVPPVRIIQVETPPMRDDDEFIAQCQPRRTMDDQGITYITFAHPKCKYGRTPSDDDAER